MANLLNKLREAKKEAAKHIGAVALAGALLFGGATGCENITKTPDNPIVDGTTEETGKYSNLLMSVLNDEYYNTVVSNTKLETSDSPALDPHPYAFLEDQGIDVNKILDGTYKASTMSFVYDDEPNNLYISTRVLIDDTYWHSFLITYKLNDKEMADYKLVYGDKSKYSFSWPAFFINDKISEIKQPTNVLSTKYSKKTHEVFQHEADSYVGTKYDYLIPSIDPTSSTYILIDYPKHISGDNVPVAPKEIMTRTFEYPYIENYGQYFEILQSTAQASRLEKQTKQATAFFLQNASIVRGKDFDATNTQ